MKHNAYILRTCNADMSSRNGFVWPREGVAECPDWKPTKECGNGLHGALWGEGDGSLLDWSNNAVWIVAGVDEWIDLDGKVKFPRADVVFAGSRQDAIDKIVSLGATGAIIGGTATAGDGGTATAGYRGTATAGEGGTATAGNYGTATAGEGGMATAGYYGTATAGNYGTATAGEGGTICISHWDGERSRIVIGYVGEDGIKPDTAYRVRDGKLVEA